MRKSRFLPAVFVWSGVLIIGAAPPRAIGGGVIVEIRPVQPEGLNAAPYPPGTVINGNTISLPEGGTKVWLNFLVFDWAPHLAHNLQASIDLASLASGSGAPLVKPLEACTQHSECEDAHGLRSSCQGGTCDIVFYDCFRH